MQPLLFRGGQAHCFPLVFQEFRTLHGRSVKDGGGIDVDFVAPASQLGELEASLMEKGLFFYFANDYAAKASSGFYYTPILPRSSSFNGLFMKS
mmetsp:Transcript_2981/g.14060  ORF Transcript_2981/g.14060 Transcript_2981/m.14060 type:complete len:94 (+) Transcript_2981:1695-1976(+)